MSSGAKPACEADGCDAVAENVGLCWMHRYKQLFENEQSINRFNVKRLDARVAELEAALREVMQHRHHSGSCCTFDGNGKVIVTPESCQCNGWEKRARAALAGAGGGEKP